MSNLTTEDNAQTAQERTVPYVSTERTIALSGSTEGSVQLPEDIKSAVVVADGAAIQFWPSYNDGTTDVLAGVKVNGEPVLSTKANAITHHTIKNVKDGSTFQEAQQLEFNKINAVITAGSGTATAYVYPSMGEPNNV